MVYFFSHAALARVDESGPAILEVLCEGLDKKYYNLSVGLETQRTKNQRAKLGAAVKIARTKLDFFFFYSFLLLDHIYKVYISSA